MMMYFSVIFGFLLVLTADARIGKPSDFGSDTEQTLLYDLICKTASYEVRRYDAAKWVTTEEASFLMEIASVRAFKRLFRYITGTNVEEKKVEMTAPVLMKIQDGYKPFWETKAFSMSFLLPTEDQKNPPTPTDDKVQINEMPAMTVYVRSYGGWTTTMSDKSNARALSMALDSVEAKYQKDFHYAAGYNSPMTLFNRHNEVWYISQGEPVCSSSEELDTSS